MSHSIEIIEDILAAFKKGNVASAFTQLAGLPDLIRDELAEARHRGHLDGRAAAMRELDDDPRPMWPAIPDMPDRLAERLQDPMTRACVRAALQLDDATLDAVVEGRVQLSSSLV